MDLLRDKCDSGDCGERRRIDCLVCFAVKEEIKYLSPPVENQNGGRVSLLLTGIGRRNAAQAIREALRTEQPRVVLTCGFAGGLNPKLSVGSIVFDEDPGVGLKNDLIEMGALPSRFYCSKRVAISAAEKQSLWLSTGADAVEMESSVIRTICRELHIPSATIRVISDTAHDDLPLDFNAMMTADDRINYLKLLWAMITSPRRVPKLIEFQKQTIEAAKALGALLEELLAPRRRAF